MSGSRIAIADATKADLLSFATAVLGLDADDRSTKDSLLAKIAQAGWSQDTIPQMRPATVPRTGGASSKEAAREEKEGRTYYKILIPNEEKPGGEEPVPVSVNGRCMFVPRGEPVMVPEEYVEVLENAQAFVYDPFDGNGMGGLKPPRVVRSYPIQYA